MVNLTWQKAPSPHFLLLKPVSNWCCLLLGLPSCRNDVGLTQYFLVSFGLETEQQYHLATSGCEGEIFIPRLFADGWNWSPGESRCCTKILLVIALFTSSLADCMQFAWWTQTTEDLSAATHYLFFEMLWHLKNVTQTGNRGCLLSK